MGGGQDAFLRVRRGRNIGNGARRRRRRLLSAIALVPFVVMAPAPAASPKVTPFAVPLPIPATLTSPDITLTAQQAQVPVLPGSPTKMWTYNGTFPGPTIRRPTGQPTRVTLINHLPPEVGALTLHHHGAHARSEDDGQPADLLIPHDGSRTYTYDMTEAGTTERGATQWYHDHRMDVTGRNVWMGLAGMFILDDPAEAAINAALPNGAQDVPLMIADRKFDADNQISYQFTSEGVIGDLPLVNGAPQPFFDVGTRRYRLRVLNASNSRSYYLALSNGRSFVQVASEAGLLPAPVVRDRILLGPAERAEVIVDFAGMLGQDVTLLNLAASGAMSQLMQFRVRRDEADPSTVPSALRPPRQFEVAPHSVERTWVLGREVATGMWTINGMGFDHNRIDAKPELGKSERWTFINASASDHIVHIHDVDWRIVARTAAPPGTIEADEGGAKETFRIHAQEVVVIESTFTDHTGRYMWHCHILEHEDFAMMAQFEVQPPGGLPVSETHHH
jgi:FtsP/CotA-like multicopper oxidase with cupredoxin domain